ncbi:protein GVQW3-like [Uloborus diversus]|uniref:protein GVQW3-like n=1 Tax=Uloborus diversus TaxID=327109 RepID=UPI0024099E24|nr:protein GVQW3-like [Uloborus diversus]
MQRTFEQRYEFKLCVELGKSASDTSEMCKQEFEDNRLSKAHAFRWHKCFKDGWKSVEDEPQTGCPSNSRTDANVERVRVVLNSDCRRLSVRMIVDEVGLDKMTVHSIIAENLRNAPPRPPSQ